MAGFSVHDVVSLYVRVTGIFIHIYLYYSIFLVFTAAIYKTAVICRYLFTVLLLVMGSNACVSPAAGLPAQRVITHALPHWLTV